MECLTGACYLIENITPGNDFSQTWFSFLILINLSVTLGKTLLKEKLIPLDNGYAKCDECIRLFTKVQLTDLPYCNEE